MYLCYNTRGSHLVPVGVRLVRALDRDAHVLRLLLRRHGQLGPVAFEVEPRHLLVQLLGQHVHLRGRVLARVLLRPQLDLCQGLVGEGAAHDDGGVGWPVAHPRLSSRPSARTMIPWPSGNTKRSTCGLMLTFWAAFSRPAMSISLSKCPMFPTMALFFIRAMVAAMRMPLFPVVVTKMSAIPTTSSRALTVKPSMHACNAQMGSISVTWTTQPLARRAMAQPFPTSP